MPACRCMLPGSEKLLLPTICADRASLALWQTDLEGHCSVLSCKRA